VVQGIAFHVGSVEDLWSVVGGMASGRRQYPFHIIEPKWQEHWARQQSFRAWNPGERVPAEHGFASRHGNVSPEELPKYYVLDMFPYPSGAGLHVGHPEGYTATDIVARYRRARGFHVLHPMGWDAFGLPAEQYAIDTGTHPAITTRKNIDTFRRQIQMLGLSYDWTREVNTTDPGYFKWTQWIFLQLYKKGLAYEAEVPVWWCDGCKAVLANEEVNADGTCDRKGHKEVFRRPLRQWILRITSYAEKLLQDLELVNWPESIKQQQRNWIGRSEGAEVDFAIENSQERLRVFTTRPDTLFGATYMVVAPEHSLVEQLTSAEQRNAVEGYRAAVAKKSDRERTDLGGEKTGVFTGSYAVNPVNGQRVPIWIADYVLATYGTGAIMAVPGHDERDLEFATQFKLPVLQVVQAPGGKDWQGYVEDGVAINSANGELSLNGLSTPEAKKKISAWLESKGVGKKTTNYKLRDWLFSRQRYWGEPIPIVHCPNCGTVPVPESELPLELPEVNDFRPTADAEPPLARATEWVNCRCPKCGGAGRRETNTMPQWAGSCWYYLRYLDPNNPERFCGANAERYWMGKDADNSRGVDLYIGGAEHAVLHLLYSRFWHKVLYELGHVSTPEPFMKLVNQGMILGEDGRKMSKTFGNVVNPDEVVRDFGADAFRLYEMFMGPLDMVKPWSTKGVEGVYRFLGRTWRLFVDESSEVEFEQGLTTAPERGMELLEMVKLNPSIKDVPATAGQLKVLHACIKKVTEDLEGLRFNTAISALMVFVNEAMTWESKPPEVLREFLVLLQPFAPHLAEELWAKLEGRGGHGLSYIKWPEFDPALLVETTIEIPVQVNGKLREVIKVPAGIANEELERIAKSAEKVKPFLEGKVIKKVIIVPNKMVNIVVGQG
jgi:leucyl-tRNA synthetase